MILIIDALNKGRFSAVLDDMFQLRARVFGDRLGWDVDIRDGKEIDDFDRLDPAYVIGLDDDGNVVSAVRALQTTGPHMLADVFSSILAGEPPIRSATMWESTRFCVDTQRLTRGKDKNSVSYATCELMIGSLEYARRSGIQDIVTVIDPVMDRVLKRSDNAPYGYVGKTVPMGKVSALAALLDCTPERIGKVRDFAGIHHDVFADEDAVEDLIARKTAKERPSAIVFPFPNRAKTAVRQHGDTSDITRAELSAYCDEQIASAQSPEEITAAVALKRELFGDHFSPRHNNA